MAPPSRLASRPGTSRAAPSLCCNRCNKGLWTTLFVCACDCVFCEACTYEHFQSNSNCPSCRRQLAEGDFMELCISDPSTQDLASAKITFQTILTKLSADHKNLSYQEMCSRVLKSMDNDRRAVRFLLKQLVFDSSHKGQHSGSVHQAYEQLKQQYASLKQSSHSQRIGMEQQISDLQQKNAALTKSNHELQAALHSRKRSSSSGHHHHHHPSSHYSHSGGSSFGKENRHPVMTPVVGRPGSVATFQSAAPSQQQRGVSPGMAFAYNRSNEPKFYRGR